MAALLTTAATAPASAKERPGPQPEVVTISGSFTGTGQLLTAPCSYLRQVVDGGGEWSPVGASTFELDFCTNEAPDGVNNPTNGTFTITTSDGTLTGTLGGSVRAGGPAAPYPFVFELVVTGGTGRFATATGSFQMEGGFGPAAFTVDGTITGTVTIPPPTPQSVDDCKHGGWRDYVDDEGNPFHNKRACIRDVLDQP